MNFYGYKRPDGRVGVRNKVLILPASVCASDTTRIISQQVVGSVTFNNQLGCSQVASDQQFTMDVMAGYAANPNVYGTVVVSLGCENCQMDLVVKAIQERTNKPLKQVIIQEAGGTLKAIDMAVRYAKEMVEEASLLQKEEFPMSELIIGTECGGSDPTSGLAANPLIGQLSDLIVKEGGTSILSETTEFIGAEHILARRAINKEVHDRIFEIVHRYEDSLRLVGEDGYFSGPFSNQLIAAYVGSCTGVSYITHDGWELGVAPLPGNTENAANTAGTNINMFATDENQQKATWEFMKFLTSTEATTKWAMETGYLPVRQSALDSDTYQEFMANDPTATACYAQSDAFFSSPAFEGSYDVQNAVNTTLEEVILAKEDAQTALDSLVSAINNAL